MNLIELSQIKVIHKRYDYHHKIQSFWGSMSKSGINGEFTYMTAEQKKLSKFLSTLEHNSTTSLVMKPRQAGITYLLCMYGLMKAFKEGKTILFISPTLAMSRCLDTIVNNITYYGCGVMPNTQNKHAVEFMNGGRFLGATANSAESTLCGLSVDTLICDEIGCQRNISMKIEDICKCAIPQLYGNGGNLIMTDSYESHGLYGNLPHKICVDL